MSQVKLISLDLETTGLEPGKHVPLSIGAVDVLTGKDFYCQLEYDELLVNPKALAINKLNIVDPPGPDGDYWNRSLPVKVALNEFHEWLDTRRYGGFDGVSGKFNENFELRALGKNVGIFDLPMLKSIWPYKWQFSYRSVDLLSIFYYLDKDCTEQAWYEFEKEKPDLFNNLGGRKGAEHHALGDAWWNVFAWRFCKDYSL